MACPSVISGPGDVSRPAHVARCWRGHTCPCNARNACWFRHDEDGEGNARAATACAGTPLPPASLLLRLSSLLEQIAEVLKVFPQELFQPRIVEPIVDVGGVCWRMGKIVEQSVAVPVPQIMEGIVDGVQHVPHERVQYRVVEQIVADPVPQIMKGIVAGVQHVPQERVQNRVVEQIGSVPAPPDREGYRGRCAACATGARAESRRGADRE